MDEKKESESPLERLRKRLYAPASVDGVVPHTLPPSHPAAPEHWASEPLVVHEKSKISGTALFLGFAFVFFVVAAGATITMLFLGGRSVSADKVTIFVEGPTSASPGEAIPLLITIHNENPVAISLATLRLSFPEGTGEADNPSVPLLFYEETLGEIAAGASVRRSVRASFFGAEDQQFSIPIEVEYTTGNSNAVFVKDQTYELTLSNAPVLLAVTTLSEVAPGQPLSLLVSVRSNTTTALERIAVHAEYPPGFIEKSTDPVRGAGSYFTLGTLAPGEEKEIRISGILSGQEGEERVFHFKVGTLKSEGAKEFAVSYSKKEASLMITRPFLAVDLSINRDTGDTLIARAGEPLTALLSWENAVSSVILDGTIEVMLSGEALDTTDVDVTNGFYRSVNRTVLFDRDTAPGLGNLAPGDVGNGSFIFRTKTGSAMNVLRNPSLTLVASVSGRRVGENRVAETVTSAIRRVIKIQTDLSLSMRSLRTIGAFENMGPWPPKADEETTYTIELTTGNTVNNVGGALVRLTLPSYIRYTGEASPASEIVYNETTRELIWTQGDLAAGGAGKASFQVALLPSASQKGTSPKLVSDAALTGFDRFVEKEVQVTASAVDTQTSSDPSYQTNYGIVTY
ncbi:MAG: hypothetical protein WBK28_01575 [Minisyncoccia bacterium]